MLDNILSFLGIISVVSVVLLGAYFTTRWTASRMGGVQSFKVGNQKLALVSRLPLGREQQLVVVKIAHRHVVIGCTATNLSFITELTKAESEEFFNSPGEGVNEEVPSFSHILRGMKNNSSDKQDPKKD